MIRLEYKNPEDRFCLRGMAAKCGAISSRRGNGVCPYVHLERFAKPYATLVGADSHTTTAGALGSFALGIGGMDAAVAMAGFPFELQCPAVVRVVLENELAPWVSAKDVILEMLRRITVKGGINKAFAFDGPGVATLNATERATICNMILELGATACIFPGDAESPKFLELQERPRDCRELLPYERGSYD